MEMVFHEAEDETSMANESPDDASAKDDALQSHSDEDGKVTAPGAKDGIGMERKKNFCRAAALCLGLLCLLLLFGLITLVSLYTKSNAEREMEMVLSQTSYNNLTKEKDQFQISYNNLIKEKDQFQISYNNLTKERDQLQERFEALTKDRNDLRRKLQDAEASLKNVTKERADLERMLNTFGWTYFRGSFYHVSSNKNNWQQSRDDCLQKGADLMIINSKDEENFAKHFKKCLWIGLTDAETEGKWKWVDGTPLTESYWGYKEPNGGRSENCGDIQYFGAENSWNDEPCSYSCFWICEKKLPP